MTYTKPVLLAANAATRRILAACGVKHQCATACLNKV